MTLQSKKLIGGKLKKCAVFCAAATILVASAAPAHAYYNYAYGLGNLLWPVRALVYPLAITPWSYRSPAYMASTAIQAAARSSYRVVPQQGIYGSSLNYTEAQVATQSPTLMKVPQGPSDQINYARWVKPTDLADRELLARAPGAPPLQAVQGDANAQGNYSQVATTGTVGPAGGEPPIGVPVTYGNQNAFQAVDPNTNEPLPAPPLAKQKKSKSSKQSNSAAFQQSAMPMNMTPPGNVSNVPQHLSSPLAAHFIETVNSRFDGDISKALKHSETRNLAEAMGLVDRKNFSVSSLNQARIDAISHIFKDSSLDPGSKLDAMKILLRASSAPATAQAEDRSF
ncbi:MAG TPA: hypothetical protein PKZ32_16665 [Candidatus Melainabacteria bacterium]|nr:hypothetical protein [Candidatus Melainabacteria bacterium]